MDKMSYPRGLIRYTTQHAMDGKPTRLVRPRTIIYAALLGVVAALFLTQLATRMPLGLDIIRDRNQLYRERMGMIENVYTLKVLNLEDVGRRYTVKVDGIEGLEPRELAEPVAVPAGGVLDLPLVVRVDPAVLQRQSTPIEITLAVAGQEDIHVTEEAKFLGPRP